MLVLLASAAVSAEAASGAPGLTIGVPPRKLTVGDRLPVRITAQGGPGLLWGTPTVAVSGSGATWAVVQKPHPIPQAQPPAWDMVLVPLAVGKLALPSVSVSVRDARGSVSKVTADHLPEVTVASVLPPGGKIPPAPLDDPVGVRGFPWEWIPPVLAGLLPLALLGMFLWWRRKKRQRGTRERAVHVPPLDELRMALDRIGHQIGHRPLDEICDQLAASVRRFLKRRTGESAMEMTTFELTRLARQRGWPAGVQRGIQDALGLSDAVRFARRETAEEAVRAAVRAAGEAASELDELLTKLEAGTGAEGAA